MDTKLTLSLDKSVIEQAKKYAKSNKTSLSKLIESYLASLNKRKEHSEEITPLVESLSGVIDLNNAENTTDDYGNFLMEKYK
ncbi:DUF6364 family protein [Aquimarina agarilytica]|uniref:DUF6364 family protein n=1 Tax=Aquimarina agarilytica TaxID=1087449 RepID=UPI000288482A|nr:DUF6364 family protein [Aquimarina agarilytica]